MILKRKIFLILISVFFLFSKAYSLAPVESAMRIGIITDTNSFVLSSKDPFTITDAQNKNLKFQKNASIKLSFSKDKAIGGNDSMILPIRIESKGDIYINNK
ncbi:MAG: hypothetical protein LBV66_01010, partial [Elusimicrobiota bacterium]|nr:hypothetical protein [Elusimicrobiota bacterium]